MRQQRELPQPSPSVREVAAHFKVPVSAVARNYAHLEREGLLTRVRGSRTLLKGREFGRRLHVRAVVGLPASLFSFITLQHYRQFLESMRGELARRDFAAAHVFFRGEHVRDSSLVDRLTGKGVDAVVWYLPDRATERALAYLKDRGVPVVGICEGGFPVIPCRYAIRRRPAVRTILRNWAATGVTCVTILTEPLKRSAPDEERWERAVEEQRIRVDIATP